MAEPNRLPTIQRTEIDGVPVFWTPVEGPRVASLEFRVGRADEPAAKTGITHVVEHLALAPLADRDVVHNGFVSPIRTVFHGSGSDEELRGFIQDLIATLGDLPLDRIAMERRILSQEAASRGANPNALHRWFRYGNRSHGLIGTPEIGLDWLGPEPVASWAVQYFTRENAALWWSGPVPPDLRLPLPSGERMVVPTPTNVPLVTFPARTDLGGTGISISYVAVRSAAAHLALDILTRRIRQDLRFARGLIYDVNADYDPEGPETAHISLGMDCRREDAESVLSGVLAAIDALVGQGPTTEEVAREVNTFVEATSHPTGGLGFLDSAAFDALLGRPPETPDDLVEEYLRVTPDDVRKETGAIADSLLVFAPRGAYDADRLHPYPNYSSEAVSGRSIRPTGLPFGPRARKDRLIVGPAGISYLRPTGEVITVRYEDCVALRHWEGPARELWGADGFKVGIVANEWAGGDKVVQEIDAAIARELVVCGEHGIGGLEVDQGPPPSYWRRPNP